jgi:hypothetical protein
MGRCSQQVRPSLLYSGEAYIVNFQGFNILDDSPRIKILNLVFKRLMREIVYYHEARLDFDTKAVLADQNHPLRKDLLRQVADKESHVFLSQFATE